MSNLLKWQINFGRQKSGLDRPKNGRQSLLDLQSTVWQLCTRTISPIEYLATMSLSQQRPRTGILCSNIWLLGGRHIEILKECSRVVLLNKRNPCFYYNQKWAINITTVSTFFDIFYHHQESLHFLLCQIFKNEAVKITIP